MWKTVNPNLSTPGGKIHKDDEEMFSKNEKLVAEKHMKT